MNTYYETMLSEKPPVKTAKETQLEQFIGHPLICISAECENLTVGIGKKIVFMTKGNEPYLIVDDIVRKKEIIPTGLLIRFTMQKFDILNRIEPQKRVDLFFRKKQNHELIFNPKVWANKVYEAMKVEELV